MNFNIEDQPYKCSNRLAGYSILAASKAKSHASVYPLNFLVNPIKNYQY